MIIIAGHICLDIIPRFLSTASLDPGSLVRVGQATLSTGGVSNVGVALYRLGFTPRLIHKIGDDLFGNAIQSILNRLSPDLAAGLRIVPGETTSYSLVIAPQHVDRMFIHCPGANDHFTGDDIQLPPCTDAHLDQKYPSHLHFGYPPIMRSIYSDGGESLASAFSRIQSRGFTTSLDLCSVDPASDAANVDWRQWLGRVLPTVDYFTPSFDELSVMLDRPVEMSEKNILDLSRICSDLGAKRLLMKLGDQGLFYADQHLQHHQPCRKVDVVNANGAGDCTIAAFLASRSRGDEIKVSLELASATGAACCEAADATSGVPHLSIIETRIASGWDILPSRLHF